MVNLGQVITEQKDNIFNEEYISVISSFDKIDDSIPVLIIGYEQAKRYAEYKNYDFDVLEKKFSENEFWTFKKTEKRNEYNEDIKKFVDYSYNRMISLLKYYYVDMISLNFHKKRIFYNILFKSKKRYCYFSDGMLYTLYKGTNILGISLKITEYCGISSKKVLQKVKDNKNNIFFSKKDVYGMKIPSSLKKKQFIVPYLLYLHGK